MPPLPSGTFSREQEAIGLFLVSLEAALADLEFVVTEVVGTPPSPGFAESLTRPETEWVATFEMARVGSDTQVATTLCDGTGRCYGQQTPIEALAPEPAVADLVGWFALVMGAPFPETAPEDWGQRTSADEYAVLVAGRSAATWYGLRPPVSDAARGDPMRDPIDRAVFIDPAMGVAQWVLGRRYAAEEDWLSARMAFTRATLARPHSDVFRADEAVALAMLERWEAARAAWDALDATHPNDPRFLVARARTLLAVGDLPAADQVLDRLDPALVVRADVLQLRASIAAAGVGRSDYDAILEAWQEAAPDDPEPVRRRIGIRIASGDLSGALLLTGPLDERGARIEAARYALALGIGLRRWETAAAAAEILDMSEMAERIRARAQMEEDPTWVSEALRDSQDPEVLIPTGFAMLRGDRPEEALALAERVLARTPFRPEALALKASALDTLGREGDAARVWADLARADPDYPRP